MGNIVQKPKHCIKDFKRKHTSFTCEICYGSCKKKFRHSRWKSHPICLECIVRYIISEVGYSCSRIKCPHPSCHKILDPVRYRSIIPSELFQKWFDLLSRETVLKLERAYCPFSDCSVPILNECWDTIGKTKCPNCKREICFKCEVPWTACGKCGDEPDRYDENDDLFRQLVVSMNWIRCPACYLVVERISGCPKIRCRCGVIFCYKCGRKQSDHKKGICPRIPFALNTDT